MAGTPKKRSVGRPFKAGVSGNPGGRPSAIAPIRDLAREHAPGAIETLFAISQDDAQPAAARVAASNAILDRAWGKPPQPITGEDGEGNLTTIMFSWGPEGEV